MLHRAFAATLAAWLVNVNTHEAHAESAAPESWAPAQGEAADAESPGPSHDAASAREEPEPPGGTEPPAIPFEPSARAAPEPPDAREHRKPLEATQELDRLEMLLRTYEEKEHDYRVWSGLTSLAMGAAIVPVGIKLNQRMEHYSTLGALSVAFGAGGIVGGGLALLIGPGWGYADLARLVAESRQAGKGPDEIIALVEAEWQRRAEDNRFWRKVAGGMLLGGGALLIGISALEAWSDPLPGMSEETYLNSSAAGLILGGLSMLQGIQWLMMETSLEASWDAYRLTAPRRSVRMSVGYAPAPGGGMFQLVGAF